MIHTLDVEISEELMQHIRQLWSDVESTAETPDGELVALHVSWLLRPDGHKKFVPVDFVKSSAIE